MSCVRNLLCLVVLAGFGPRVAAAAELSLGASTTTPALGATVTVLVRLDGVVASFLDWNQYLAFDPARLELVEQQAGDLGTFLPDTSPLAVINAAGTVRAGGMTLPTAPLASDGVVGRFVFRTLAAGTTTISSAAQGEADPFGSVLIRPPPGNEAEAPGIGDPLVLVIGGAPPERSIAIEVAGCDDPVTVLLPGATADAVAGDRYTFEDLDGSASHTFGFATAPAPAVNQ